MKHETNMIKFLLIDWLLWDNQSMGMTLTKFNARLGRFGVTPITHKTFYNYAKEIEYIFGDRAIIESYPELRIKLRRRTEHEELIQRLR